MAATSALALRSDERLARQVAGGNDAAFDLLYRRYESTLFGYCRSITRNTDDAGDAMQNAMLKALLALRRQDRSAPVRPWLFRIVHNEAVNQITRKPKVAPLPDSRGDAVASADERAVDRERLAELVADLRELPLRQRAALVMRELSGLEYDEIALALDVTDNNARQLVFAARTSLKDRRAGRAMSCDGVRDLVLYADARRLRGRSVRAHLHACESCRDFAATDPRRDVRRAASLAPWSPLAGGGLIDAIARILGASGSAVAATAVAKTATAAVVVAAGIGVADVAREPAERAPGSATTERSDLTPLDRSSTPAARTATPAPAPGKVVMAAATTTARIESATPAAATVLRGAPATSPATPGNGDPHVERADDPRDRSSSWGAGDRGNANYGGSSGAGWRGDRSSDGNYGSQGDARQGTWSAHDESQAQGSQQGNFGSGTHPAQDTPEPAAGPGGRTAAR